jgi:hypothetical protein
MMRPAMHAWIARVLALVLTVLPWASSLAQMRPAKPEASLSSPHHPQASLQEAAPTGGTPPSQALSFGWHPDALLRSSHEVVRVQLEPAPEASTPRYLVCSRLQLDGG